MKRYRFEVVLGALLVALFFAFSAWQSAGKLMPAEVEHYVGILDKRLPTGMDDRAQFIARVRAWGMSDDGRPVYMLELMRLHEKLRPFPGGPTQGTPAQANARYEDAVVPMLLKNGGQPLLAGNTTGIQDRWDRVAVVRYPGRRDFFALLADPAYLEVMPHKLAALEVVLAPVAAQIVLPDLRWPLGGGLAAIFLIAGWVRSARRPSS